MSTMRLRDLAALAVMTAVPAGAVAAGSPTVEELVFQAKHLEKATKGSEVVYHFERKVSDQRLGGEAFSDEIKLDVVDDAGDGKRNVVLHIFTNDRARDPYPLNGMDVNPLAHWYLDRSVATFKLFAGGSDPYLKDRFKKAMRDPAAVEQASVQCNGKDVSGYRIKLVPFQGDPAVSKMSGFEISHFEMVVSDAVPGYFCELVTVIESTIKGTPKIEERVTLVSKEEAK